MAVTEVEADVERNLTVNVSEFIVEWNDRIGAVSPEPVSHEKFMEIVSNKMGINLDMASELDSVCQLSSLRCEGEPPGIYSGPSSDKKWKDVPASVTNLVSLNLQREEQSKRQKDINYKGGVKRFLKYKEFDAPWFAFLLHLLWHNTLLERLDTWNKVHEIKHRLHREEKIPVPRDAIITIQVYNPIPTTSRPLRILSEIHVLGQQTLTSVRDKILCRLDNIVPGDLSDHPDVLPDSTAKDQFPSGFFFIEGVFYSDMRHPNSRDYSLVIRDWAAQNPHRGLGPYEAAKMEETTLDMLSFQLGVPYLYTHHADCEHLLVFSDIRLVHPEDCLKVEEYPLTVPKYKAKPIKCRVCMKNSAMWMTRDSPSAPEDPCYFCDTCLRMLHYNERGEKIGNFRLYSCKDAF